VSSYASELLQLNDSWSSVHKNGIQPTVSDVLFPLRWQASPMRMRFHSSGYWLSPRREYI